jgi:hypothetical protein
MSPAEIITVVASAGVALLQFVDDKSKHKKKAKNTTAVLALVILGATTHTTSTSKAEADLKEAESARKQELAIQKLDSTYSANLDVLDSNQHATVHTLDSTKTAYLGRIDTMNMKNRDELDRLHTRAEMRLDYQYANTMSTTREMFNLLSKRNVKEFLGEKVPVDMTYLEAEKLISQAVQKYITDSLLKYVENKKFTRGTSGVWMSDGPNVQLNYPQQTQTAMVFWDAYVSELEGPDREAHISVIICDSLSEDYEDYLEPDRTSNLYYQYRNWYDRVRISGVWGNKRETHTIIFIVEDENTVNAEDLQSMLNHAHEFKAEEKPIREGNQCKVVIYTVSEAAKVKLYLQDKVFK